MCGLFFSSNSNIDSLRIGKISNGLAKRGPDDEVIISERCTLIFRRLIIRGGEQASQPYSMSTGKWSMFNGELYNEEKLRISLKDQSGIEVIGDMNFLAEYFDRDPNIIRKSYGMFAGLILDLNSRMVTLFRDPTGEKPLFLYINKVSGVIEVSSRADNFVLERPLIEYIDRDELRLGFSTLKENGHELLQSIEPGHKVEISLDTGAMSSQRYWNWPIRSGVSKSSPSLIERGRELLEEVISEQLLSDVPVCTFLSGGIDSTLLATVISKVSLIKIPALTLEFDETNISESALASHNARQLNLDHFVYRTGGEELASVVAKAVDAMDLPILDPACLGIYILSEKARLDLGCAVAMSGDGGDELVQGYRLYDAAALIDLIYRNAVFREFAQGIAWIGSKVLPRREVRYSKKMLLARLADGMRENDKTRMIETLLSPFGGSQIYDKFLRSFAGSPNNDESIKSSQEVIDDYYHGKVLPDLYLRKSDVMSMANSLELRSPFLDVRLIEFFSTISSTELAKGKKKWPLKSILDTYQKSLRFSNSKNGFTMPLGNIIAALESPSWELEKFGLSNRAVEEVWKRARKGDPRELHSAYSLYILNLFGKKIST